MYLRYCNVWSSLNTTSFFMHIRVTMFPDVVLRAASSDAFNEGHAIIPQTSESYLVFMTQRTGHS